MKVKNKRRPKEQIWYNNNLKSLRNTLVNYGRLLGNYPYNKEYRMKYFSTLKLYRKKCKCISRKYKQDLLDKLDNLH